MTITMVMTTVNVATLKAKLSAYLKATGAGKEFVVVAHSHPVARLMPPGVQGTLAVQPPRTPVARLRDIRGVRVPAVPDAVRLIRADRDARHS